MSWQPFAFTYDIPLTLTVYERGTGRALEDLPGIAEIEVFGADGWRLREFTFDTPHEKAPRRSVKRSDGDFRLYDALVQQEARYVEDALEAKREEAMS
jgi:hypothetical protein